MVNFNLVYELTPFINAINTTLHYVNIFLLHLVLFGYSVIIVYVNRIVMRKVSVSTI